MRNEYHIVALRRRTRWMWIWAVAAVGMGMYWPIKFIEFKERVAGTCLVVR